MDPRTKPQSTLVALASAAVLSVYSAGYFRTKPAADRFAAEAEARKGARQALPPPPGVKEAEREHLHGRRERKVGAGATTSIPPVPRLNQSKPAAPDSHRVARADTTRAEPVRAVSDSAPTVPTAPIRATPPVDSQPAAAPTPAGRDSAVTAPKWIDGTFTGWGTSRHGDIQAEVVIKNGRIVEARIIQCLTRYSCSWISALPGQVVSRQSPDVDYVSGATQSADAFYGAIVQALNYAK